MKTSDPLSLASLNARYTADGQPRLAAMREETRREPVSEGGAACVLLGGVADRVLRGGVGRVGGGGCVGDGETVETMTTRERPILFSGKMVRAILDGRKVQTRRVVKPQPVFDDDGTDSGFVFGRGKQRQFCYLIDQKWPRANPRPNDTCAEICPYGQPGDRLWVRETFGYVPRAAGHTQKEATRYRADGECSSVALWHPSIHMPRALSRLTLEICSVKVERVQDISEADATAEGVERTSLGFRDYELPAGVMHGVPATYSFQTLWDSINFKRGFGWSTNCWVWAIEFRRAPAKTTTGEQDIEQNIERGI